MKPEEYPKNDKLAEKLGKLMGTEIQSKSLDITRELRENGTIDIAEGAVCKVSYRDNLREGTITLTVRTREKVEIIRSKEFNTTMAPEDVDQVSAYFHVLPIHAFKSAIQAVLDAK